MKQFKSFLVVLLLVAWAVPARADVSSERRFLICQTGSVTTADDAKPYIDGFGKYLAKKLGWGTDTYEVRFETVNCLKTLETWKPAYATIPLGDFLAAETRLGLKPLVLAKVGGKITTRYRLLVKKGTYPSLDALKGKILTGNMVGDTAFLSRVIFKGALDAAAHFVLKQKKRPLKAIRKVSRGKADAVLVDALQFDSLQALAVFQKLEVIFTSEPIPNLGLVHVEGAAKGTDVAVFKDALIAMCRDPEGGEICKTFSLEGFIDAKAGALQGVRTLYGTGR